jgi:hypothetical protein
MDSRDRSILISYAKDLAVAHADKSDTTAATIAKVKYLFGELCSLMFPDADVIETMRSLVFEAGVGKELQACGFGQKEAVKLHGECGGDKKLILKRLKEIANG